MELVLADVMKANPSDLAQSTVQAARVCLSFALELSDGTYGQNGAPPLAPVNLTQRQSKGLLYATFLTNCSGGKEHTAIYKSFM